MPVTGLLLATEQESSPNWSLEGTKGHLLLKLCGFPKRMKAGTVIAIAEGKENRSATCQAVCCTQSD